MFSYFSVGFLGLRNSIFHEIKRNIRLDLANLFSLYNRVIEIYNLSSLEVVFKYKGAIGYRNGKVGV